MERRKLKHRRRRNFSKSVEIHSKKRAAERYNIYLSNTELGEIVKNIKNNKFIQSTKLTHSRSMIIINHNNRLFKIIYSTKHKKIITFLPFEYNQFQEEIGKEKDGNKKEMPKM